MIGFSAQGLRLDITLFDHISAVIVLRADIQQIEQVESWWPWC